MFLLIKAIIQDFCKSEARLLITLLPSGPFLMRLSHFLCKMLDLLLKLKNDEFTYVFS
jgi:hypothetical protein